MNNHIPHVQIDGHTLLAVPAVQFRASFAEQVNQLCRDPKTKPDAIAVALGHQMTTACASWLTELGVGTHKRTKLPCMLALAKPNRCLRASTKELTRKLQETTGKDLNDLGPDTLNQLLGYSSESVLFLSPTDSIIESIRAALELNVPLYGVDLEEAADAKRKEVLINDSFLARDELRKYVSQNASYAEYGRDVEVDGRREIVMAARLKAILKKHQRVLFTGGLAHWRIITKLLQDPILRPAPPYRETEIPSDLLTRAIAHPLLAVYHMDIFPQLAAIYERSREHAKEDPIMDKQTLPSSTDLFRKMLTAVYAECLEKSDSTIESARLLEDLSIRSDFEQLLFNLCVVKQKLLPDLWTIMQAANGIMSPLFCEVMANVIMKFPWVTSAEFPDLPILAPAPLQSGPKLKVEYIDANGNRSKQFFINYLPGIGEYEFHIPIPWKWSVPAELINKSPSAHTPEKSDLRTWPPCDYLMTAMSVRATELGYIGRPNKRTELFEGSLQDGIDIKTTIRACSRGDDRIYVFNVVRPKQDRKSQSLYFDPVVWIFGPASEDGSWELFSDSLVNVRQYVLDRERLSMTAHSLGTSYLAAAAFDNWYDVDPSMKEAGIRNSVRHYGVVYFIPANFSGEQDGKWLEATSFQRTPLFNGGGWSGVKKMYWDRHHIGLDSLDWSSSLIRMAIPYADSGVTVVAPDGFRLDAMVSREARESRKTLNLVRLSFFPRNIIRELTQNHVVYWPEGANHIRGLDSAERVLGQKADTNRQLVPSRLLNFGLASRDILSVQN